VLMTYGMDVDFGSKLMAALFLPSKVDLVRVQNSFISSSSFVTKNEDMYHHLSIDQSSVG
jgi:hypothetical protein